MSYKEYTIVLRNERDELREKGELTDFETERLQELERVVSFREEPIFTVKRRGILFDVVERITDAMAILYMTDSTFEDEEKANEHCRLMNEDCEK